MRGGWIALLGSLLLAGCAFDDVGTPCSVPSGDPSIVPRATIGPGGELLTQVAVSAAFNCDETICVADRAAPAYCTKPCTHSGDCPSSYGCASAVTADPGPSAQIRPDTKLCIRSDVLEQGAKVVIPSASLLGL
jgi:hypothetical protein